MFEIIGSVERVVFTNDKNGYSVIEIASEDGSITATGTMPGISVGEELHLIPPDEKKGSMQNRGD